MKELEQPLISIIVPVYKVEKYLKRCVDSILTQTYQNMEVILVDDGSPDNCGAICDRYKETDNRVVVIHIYCYVENADQSYIKNGSMPIPVRQEQLLALQILASKITVYITRMGGHLTCDALQRKKQCTQLLRK